MNIEAEAAQPVRTTASVCREVLDVEGRLDRHPYGMVAGAIGIGFILGGGLFTRLTAAIVGTGVRIGLMAAVPLLQKEIAAAIGSASSVPQNTADQGDGH